MDINYYKITVLAITTATLTKTLIAPLIRVKTLIQIQNYYNINYYNNFRNSC